MEGLAIYEWIFPSSLKNFLALCASGYYNDCLFHRYTKLWSSYMYVVWLCCQEHQGLYGTDWRPHWNWTWGNQYLGGYIWRYIPWDTEGNDVQAYTWLNYAGWYSDIHASSPIILLFWIADKYCLSTAAQPYRFQLFLLYILMVRDYSWFTTHSSTA